jgi:hypothetical protein
MKGKNEEFSKREIRISELKNNRIDPELLGNLIMEHKIRRSMKPDHRMSNELAEIVIIIIEKLLGSSSWRGYTEDWKEEFRGRAIDHCLRYCHNFSPERCERGNADAFNYFAMISVRAFIQSLKKCKAYSARNVSMNHDVLYDETMWGNDHDMKIDYDSIYSRLPSMPNIDSIDWADGIS